MPDTIVMTVEVFSDGKRFELQRSLSPKPGSEVTIDVSDDLQSKLK
jgi:hypothetical protein